MKILYLVCLVALSTFALAEIDVPFGVYELSEIDEARAKAAERGRPLAVIYTSTFTPK